MNRNNKEKRTTLCNARYKYTEERIHVMLNKYKAKICAIYAYLLEASGDHATQMLCQLMCLLLPKRATIRAA